MRAKRRNQLIRAAMALLAVELAPLSDSALHDFRAGVVSAIVDPLEYAGKCEMKRNTSHAIAGQKFAQTQIMFKVNRFEVKDREGIIRKLLFQVLHRAQGAQ